MSRFSSSAKCQILCSLEFFPSDLLDLLQALNILCIQHIHDKYICILGKSIDLILIKQTESFNLYRPRNDYRMTLVKNIDPSKKKIDFNNEGSSTRLTAAVWRYRLYPGLYPKLGDVEIILNMMALDQVTEIHFIHKSRFNRQIQSTLFYWLWPIFLMMLRMQ